MADKFKLSPELLKPLLIVFLPLITAIVTANYQYVITRWEDSDKNFRDVVSKLTSKEKDVRHAAAASLGTYVKTGDRYFSETIDILTNRLSSETNHNVRNSIIGSLKKIKNEPQYRQVIDRLLTIDRNNFIQDYQMKTEVDKIKGEADAALEAFQAGELKYADSSKTSEQFILKNLGEEAKKKHAAYRSLQFDYDELQANKPMVSNMISIFLSEKQGQEIIGLDFFRSTMSNVVLTDLVMRDTTIKWATFGLSVLTDSQMTNSTIERTYFDGSDLKNTNFAQSRISNTVISDALVINTSFANSTFQDVYFIGSDLQGANFIGVTGLQPEYFYDTKNLELAIFEDPGIVEKAQDVTAEDYRRFISQSNLNDDKKEYLVPGINKEQI